MRMIGGRAYDFLGRPIDRRTLNKNQVGVSNLKQLTGAFAKERRKKYTTGLSKLKEVLDLYGPGYGKGMERTALSNIESSLISRGLGSTTLPAAAGVRVKSEIEDIRRNRLADALSAIAGYTQRSAPTPSTVASTAMGTASYGLESARFNRLNRPTLNFGMPAGYTGLLRR